MRVRGSRNGVARGGCGHHCAVEVECGDGRRDELGECRGALVLLLERFQQL